MSLTNVPASHQCQHDSDVCLQELKSTDGISCKVVHTTASVRTSGVLPSKILRRARAALST